MTRTLAATVTVDNTDGLRHVAGPSYNRARTINLRFLRFPGREGYLVQAWGSAFPEDGGGGYQGRLQRAHHDLEASVDVLRRTWQRHVIENRCQEGDTSRIRYPFADDWDLSEPDHKRRLAEVGLTLARAGHNTFRMLFHGGDKGLDTIRGHLLEALRHGENVISVESDELIVPWGMLYTGAETTGYPAPADWSFGGFWGYRHIIEHTFTRTENFDSRIAVTNPGEVVVGLNVDHEVDAQFPAAPFVTSLIEFFTPRAKVVLRSSKDELAMAFQDSAFPDHIMCFGCHGKVATDGVVENPYLRLSDHEKIYSTDLMAWLADTPLATQPFVFVGACQGGQVSSLFYSAFGKALLENGARCLVGPQVDLPPAFACEYSRRLFTDFLQPGTKLGDIVRSLTRAFIDDHANPLGLMFTLYRGIDVHLWRDEP
ncbi:hypothetical protein [Amycolatopsis sp. NPDC059657]|uniref:hypothetical protein n=1 Tax=Amycolatopsis sp. NPDC059657 TaxID=3346899 RepID=UPI00366A8A05